MSWHLTSSKYKSEVISDGIIIELPIEIEQPGILASILKDITNMQFNFIMKHKRFIRGGIATGTKLNYNFSEHETNNNDNTQDYYLISNGIARAVKIESNFVEWPVIGTNDVNLKKIIKMFNNPMTEEIIGLYETKNSLGHTVYYLNYLNFINDRATAEIFLQILIEQIQYYGSDPANSKAFNKFLWLLKLFRKGYPDQIIEYSVRM